MRRKPLQKFEIYSHARRLMRINYLLSRFPRLLAFLRRYIGEPLLLNKETKFNSYIRGAFTITGGATPRPEDYRAMRFQLKPMIAYLDAIVRSEELGKPVVWAEWCFSHEILRAFPVLIYVPETPCVVANLKGSDYGALIMEEAEMEGIPVEYCSASKSTVSAYLLKQAPEPDLIITTSHPCDSTVSVYQILHYLTKAPMYIMDTPYWDDQESYAYYEKNLWGLVRFLEKHLQQKMDWDKLKRICENVNTTNYYLRELTEMARAIPTPTGFEPLIFAWLGRISSFGSPEGAEYAKMSYQNAKHRLERQQGYLRSEQIRLIWWDVPIAFNNIHPWLEKVFGAVTVADFIGWVSAPHIDTSCEETMIRDLAQAHLQVAMARQMRGPIELFTNELQRIIDEFSGDCFIFVRHNGCKHGWASLKLVKDICHKAGLPALFLSTDIFDKRNLSEDQIKKEISTFFRTHGLA
ncbi:2-hydroxyacyl-CoA dehydratase subunit D [candidate division CSSED10-310 bacterium]|uniref:2-hydroxyacyl-CoA dehydratase subunit D n=1 Tax=candidate division CSSED10-310 bacterium TaxID=2855610 RepID=A0ABV6Z018_UNCC1